MGMTLEEITEQCKEVPEYLEDDIYLIKPIKNHPAFSFYAVFVSEKVGLYHIRAISDEIKTNKYGTELQDAFNNVKDRISKTYGKPKLYNDIDSSILDFYKKDEFWFQTLQEGARELSAVWGKSAPLTDDLDFVALQCSATDNHLKEIGQLVLYYYFSNANSVEDEQDSVF